MSMVNPTVCALALVLVVLITVLRATIPGDQRILAQLATFDPCPREARSADAAEEDGETRLWTAGLVSRQKCLGCF